jgi:hypothetical protein
MKSVYRVLPIALLGLAVTGLPLASAEEAERQQLFNGKDLDGWEHIGPGRVYVEDGLMKTEGGMGLLWYTREKLGDCTIRVVFRTTSPDDNSGVFIRIPKPPKSPWQAVNWGYEVQILGHWPESYERSEHQRTRGDDWHTTGAIYSISAASVRQHDYEPVRGPRPREGYIGIQNHHEPQSVHYREVSVVR